MHLPTIRIILQKKKKKKKKSSKSKRRSKGDFDDDDEIHASADHQQSDDNAPTKGKRKAAHQSADYYKAKKEFERHRDDILAHIPKNVKEGFREIGFTKWGKTFLPVIQLSPFDVEPGKVRDQWMTMFENCRAKKRPMTVLIFWYGVTWENRSEAYSFVPKNKVHSYQEGVSKGYNILPPKIQKKKQSGKILSSIEEQHLSGLSQVEEELKRPKEDRIKWMTQFNEKYEDLAADFASDEDSLIEEEIIEKDLENPPKDIGSEALYLEVTTVKCLEDVILFKANEAAKKGDVINLRHSDKDVEEDLSRLSSTQKNSLS
mmetsp:Transcript_23310/g.33912  ORF Transcript_23310/g.33912 Transcript_23310/m.33912 type:complete len:317 (-) Transcript_23310:652-1602(-)